MEIRRAREMIADLQPEIARNKQTIAMEKVQVEKLTKEVAKLDDLVGTGKRDPKDCIPIWLAVKRDSFTQNANTRRIKFARTFP